MNFTCTQTGRGSHWLRCSPSRPPRWPEQSPRSRRKRSRGTWRCAKLNKFISVIDAREGKGRLAIDIFLLVSATWSSCRIQYNNWTGKCLKDTIYLLHFLMGTQCSGGSRMYVQYDIPMCQSHSTQPQPIQLLPTKQKWWRKEPNNHFMSKVDSSLIQNGVHRHWFHYRILRSGPLVTGCCNGEIQSFFPKSGPFPDHFFNFSGLLVDTFI